PPATSAVPAMLSMLTTTSSGEESRRSMGTTPRAARLAAAAARRARGGRLGRDRAAHGADGAARRLFHGAADAILDVADVLQHQRMGRLAVVCADRLEDLPVVLAVLAPVL